VGIVLSTVYLPVFHDLKLTSTYEYLEKRFDKKMRLLGSILFSIGIVSKEYELYLHKFSCSQPYRYDINTMFLQMTWLPIVIYVPALAFNQGTAL